MSAGHSQRRVWDPRGQQTLRARVLLETTLGAEDGPRLLFPTNLEIVPLFASYLLCLLSEFVFSEELLNCTKMFIVCKHEAQRSLVNKRLHTCIPVLPPWSVFAEGGLTPGRVSVFR